MEEDLDKRLEQELYWLEKRFNKKYQVLREHNEQCFEHEVEFEGDRKYKLRAYLNSQYPHQVPKLVVCKSPELMPIDRAEWRGEHSTHTWQPLHGFLHICHWHPAGWSEKYWIFHVSNRRVSLNVYVGYLLYLLSLENTSFTVPEPFLHEGEGWHKIRSLPGKM